MSSTKSLSPRFKQAFTQLIADRIGITLRKSDYTGFQEFIFSRIQAVKLNLPEEYYLLLHENTPQSQGEWELLITKITNTESFFFRDKGQFKLLKNYIFPELIAQKNQQKTLQICSAGCSTGEEPYSIAILLKEIIPNLDEWNIKILGVDVNASAIETAQTGRYRAWSFRGVDTALQQRFFRETDSYYQIDNEIRKMVNFQVGNLLGESVSDPFTTIKDMDLILCRNVFIYFNSEAIKIILTKIYDALCPLGYLLVGHTELYSQNADKFHIKMFDESIAYQRPGDNVTQPASEFLSIETPKILEKTIDTEIGHEELSDLFKGSELKMRQAALNLLRQLPSDSRLKKLGNCTAAELILQLEGSLKENDDDDLDDESRY